MRCFGTKPQHDGRGKSPYVVLRFRVFLYIGAGFPVCAGNDGGFYGFMASGRVEDVVTGLFLCAQWGRNDAGSVRHEMFRHDVPQHDVKGEAQHEGKGGLRQSGILFSWIPGSSPRMTRRGWIPDYCNSTYYPSYYLTPVMNIYLSPIMDINGHFRPALLGVSDNFPLNGRYRSALDAAVIVSVGTMWCFGLMTFHIHTAGQIRACRLR